jgi:hypothetical protein
VTLPPPAPSSNGQRALPSPRKLAGLLLRRLADRIERG